MLKKGIRLTELDKITQTADNSGLLMLEDIDDNYTGKRITVLDTFNSTLPKTDEIIDIHNQLDSANNSINTINNDLTSIHNDIDTIHDDIDNINNRIDNIDNPYIDRGSVFSIVNNNDELNTINNQFIGAKVIVIDDGNGGHSLAEWDGSAWNITSLELENYDLYTVLNASNNYISGQYYWLNEQFNLFYGYSNAELIEHISNVVLNSNAAITSNTYPTGSPAYIANGVTVSGSTVSNFSNSNWLMLSVLFPDVIDFGVDLTIKTTTVTPTHQTIFGENLNNCIALRGNKLAIVLEGQAYYGTSTIEVQTDYQLRLRHTATGYNLYSSTDNFATVNNFELHIDNEFNVWANLFMYLGLAGNNAGTYFRGSISDLKIYNTFSSFPENIFSWTQPNVTSGNFTNADDFNIVTTANTYNTTRYPWRAMQTTNQPAANTDDNWGSNNSVNDTWSTTFTNFFLLISSITLTGRNYNSANDYGLIGTLSSKEGTVIGTPNINQLAATVTYTPNIITAGLVYSKTTGTYKGIGRVAITAQRVLGLDWNQPWYDITVPTTADFSTFVINGNLTAWCPIGRNSNQTLNNAVIEFVGNSNTNLIEPNKDIYFMTPNSNIFLATTYKQTTEPQNINIGDVWENTDNNTLQYFLERRPNFNNIGNVIVTDGIASGFSASSYISLSNNITLGNFWNINLNANITDTATAQNIISSRGLSLDIVDGNISATLYRNDVQQVNIQVESGTAYAVVENGISGYVSVSGTSGAFVPNGTPIFADSQLTSHIDTADGTNFTYTGDTTPIYDTFIGYTNIIGTNDTLVPQDTTIWSDINLTTQYGTSDGVNYTYTATFEVSQIGVLTVPIAIDDSINIIYSGGTYNLLTTSGSDQIVSADTIKDNSNIFIGSNGTSYFSGTIDLNSSEFSFWTWNGISVSNNQWITFIGAKVGITTANSAILYKPFDLKNLPKKIEVMTPFVSVGFTQQTATSYTFLRGGTIMPTTPSNITISNGVNTWTLNNTTAYMPIIPGLSVSSNQPFYYEDFA
jgi:hypothetical protein